MARIIELILTHERIGRGTRKDPVRLKPQLWTKSGRLVADKDISNGEMYFFPEEIGPLADLAAERRKRK